ncbi:MAG: hypothetical protein QNJ38_19185 [Prochloraceae cyanobacterium]|nr:hypothetical protein [Prochloraceae cyanobacterium]
MLLKILPRVGYLAAIASMGFVLLGCDRISISLNSNPLFAKQSQQVDKTKGQRLWSDSFEGDDWQENWHFRDHDLWGIGNTQIIDDSSGKFKKVLRVFYPKGSVSPSYSRKTKAPLGGVQFYSDLGIEPADALHLTYYLRFSNNFNFVKGGKLPGLYGGKGNTGGKIPDGTDGFSTRLMWRRNGNGEVYAYLPNSVKYGTSIDRGSWRFKPDIWYRIDQQVLLNDPNRNNGIIKLWVNGVQVINRRNLNFRSVETLKIDGILFSTFFGGSNSSWATPRDVHIDFAGFSVFEVD